MQVTRADELEKVVRRVLYRHRLLKAQMFYNTRQRSISYARFHFFSMALDEGFKIWEIQRYCERYGYPITASAVTYGANKFKDLQGQYALVRNLEKKTKAEDAWIRNYEWKGKFKNNQSFDTKLKNYDKANI